MEQMVGGGGRGGEAGGEGSGKGEGVGTIQIALQ